MLVGSFSLLFSALSRDISLSACADELLMSSQGLYKHKPNELGEMSIYYGPALPEWSTLDVCIIVVICHHQDPLLDSQQESQKERGEEVSLL